MSIIDNFSILPESEQRQFAEKLVNKINADQTFLTGFNLTITDVEANDMTGDLIIGLSHSDYIEVTRDASWSCAHDDDVDSYPSSDLYYSDDVYEEVEKVFKTFSAVVNGYNVELDINDIDDKEIVDFSVNKVTKEDSGIGRYEYWGDTGYDSHPYYEIEGTITNGCICDLFIVVSPAQN